MEKHEIDELVKKYNEGLVDPTEIAMLEQLIERGSVELTDLRNLELLEENLFSVKDPVPSMELDSRFYTMLAEEKGKLKKTSFEFPRLSLQSKLPRVAIVFSVLVAGFLAGFFFKQPGQKSEVASLTQEVSDLKEMVMLSLLEKESATDRLRAVSLTSEMGGASQKVTKALIQTLNQDANVNVRLAALDALRPYLHVGQVREELIRSIAEQNSPLVQIALADLMVAIQEKKSVEELRKLLESAETPKEVKERIQESIQTLI